MLWAPECEGEASFPDYGSTPRTQMHAHMVLAAPHMMLPAGGAAAVAMADLIAPPARLFDPAITHA
jgi:hypothetical protein